VDRRAVEANKLHRISSPPPMLAHLVWLGKMTKPGVDITDELFKIAP
jgi:hypothetical protein